MEIRSIHSEPAKTAADAVVVGIFSDKKPTGSDRRLDEAAGGMISRLVEAGEVTGKPYEVTRVLSPAGVEARQVVLVGLGDSGKLTSGTAFRAAGAAAKKLAEKQRHQIAFFLGDAVAGSLAEAAVAGAIVGCTGQDLYRAEKQLHAPAEMQWAGIDDETIERGRILGESVNLARRLVNMPAADIYPASFAAEAEKLAGECSLEVEVWDKPRLESERCGALLAVGRGSVNDPRLVKLSYRGAGDSAPMLALVGKGVTFDSGGLSIKPSESMLAMKCDMAGAATVLGAMRAIALLKLPVNVTALVGLVENMTGPAAYKLGDVLTSRKGVTIEVHNTDAEGRLVLADVLDVAVTSGAARIIDLATLTGACMVALGLDVAGLMTNDQAWCDEVREAAEACGEMVWQLPMYEEYNELIESKVADIKNVGEGRWGGAITAAKLLERFVADVPWTHIDIAGPSFRDKPKPWVDAGASGELVRTLVEVARRQ